MFSKKQGILDFFDLRVYILGAKGAPVGENGRPSGAALFPCQLGVDYSYLSI